jgi:hypothetical protein
LYTSRGYTVEGQDRWIRAIRDTGRERKRTQI